MGKDKFEKIFNYSIGCIGLIGVLATVIALFVTISSPAPVITFIQNLSDLPTPTPIIVEVTRIVNNPASIPNSTDEPIVVPTEIIPTSTPTAQLVKISIDQSKYSRYNSIELIVDSVELLPDGSMRWNLSFWNQGTGNVTIGFENTKTYLADEFGNRYSVINDDANNGSLGHSVYTVQPGERQRHWLTFPARIDNAQTFTVGLVSFGCCSATWEPFLITVNFP